MPSTSTPLPPADGDFTVRVMQRADLDLALDWAAAEGWNPGLADGAAFHAADPGGFLLGLLGGEPVAVISAVRYGPSFGFLGLYITPPGRRGQGHGWRLWQAAIAHLGARNIGLDGVLAQQDNYRKSGFRLAHRNVRYQGTGSDAAAAVPAGVRLAELSALPLAQLAEYDRRFFPAPREAFLRQWIAPPGGAALGLLRDGDLCGYGVLRRCRSGGKIGPLFADTPEDAAALFGALRQRAGSGCTLFLDVPEPNADALALVREAGWLMVFETARMYTGAAPEIGLARTYGITSFELG